VLPSCRRRRGRRGRTAHARGRFTSRGGEAISVLRLSPWISFDLWYNKIGAVKFHPFLLKATIIPNNQSPPLSDDLPKNHRNNNQLHTHNNESSFANDPAPRTTESTLTTPRPGACTPPVAGGTACGRRSSRR
jgi:hypothetical protein